ncbi:unnamed protein product [Durusdinium trenchii]|uniref:Pentatricopeptide repeat-containing protein-mitochondrial domain-containing protein n=1 Tax=Durusdinium trenchii TaxID=1381693 RepID=A0ABP0PPK5_9DINO
MTSSASPDGTDYKWWTHSVQSGTLEHSGHLIAVEKLQKGPEVEERRHFLRLISNLGKRGKLAQAFKAAEEMKQHGLSLDLSCYTALVEASIRSHDLDLALETLNAMRAELGPRARLPKETHNDLISACGFADQWERCVELLKQLQRLPSPPCTSAYYSVVRACCRCKQYPTALQLLQQMEKHGPVHYEASQALRLELVEVLPNGHWKTWETNRAHDHIFTTWGQDGPKR